MKQQNNGSNNIQWYYIYNNEIYGPFYEDELSQDIEEGYITLDSLVRSQDMNDFEQLRYTRLYNVFYENADNTYDDNNEIYYDSDETYYADEMSNIWLWCIALVPIMSTVMYYFVSITIVFIITFCLYCFFIWKDENEIRKYGYEIGKWGWLMLIFLPSYLFVRIHKTSKNYLSAIAWIVLAIVCILFQNSNLNSLGITDKQNSANSNVNKTNLSYEKQDNDVSDNGTNTNNEDNNSKSLPILTAGTYICGEDIAEGVYYFHVISGTGELLLYSDYSSYKNDEYGYDSIISFDLKAEKASVGLLNEDMYTDYVFGIIINKGECLVVNKGAQLEYSNSEAYFKLDSILPSGMYIIGQNLVEGKYNFKAIQGSGEMLIYNNIQDFYEDDYGYDAIASYDIKEKNASVGMANEDVYTNEISNLRLEEGQVVIIKKGVKLSYGDYTEEKETSFESARDENKIEVVSESKHASDYESVLQEYTKLMENTSLTLQKETKDEILETDDITDKAEIVDNKVTILAEIFDEGTEKMADLMVIYGDYDEYSSWVSMLYDEYYEESQKIYDIYLDD